MLPQGAASLRSCPRAAVSQHGPRPGPEHHRRRLKGCAAGDSDGSHPMHGVTKQREEDTEAGHRETPSGARASGLSEGSVRKGLGAPS